MLVVPPDPLIGDLERTGLRLGFIHRLLDRPARGAFAHFDCHTGLLRGRHAGRLRSACCSILTRSLRTTSPLKSVSSEVPRIDKPCSGSMTSTLEPKAPNTLAERST